MSHLKCDRPYPCRPLISREIKQKSRLSLLKCLKKSMILKGGFVFFSPEIQYKDESKITRMKPKHEYDKQERKAFNTLFFL